MQGKAQIQLKDIRKLFEDQGYRLNAKYGTSFRYGYYKSPERTLILGAKIGIPFPTNTKIPYNLVDFYISVIIHPLWFNENTLFLLTHLSTEFRKIVKNLEPLMHEFNLGNMESRLTRVFEKYIPEINSI